MESFQAVECIYRKEIEEELARKTAGDILYLGEGAELCSRSGRIIQVVEDTEGVFILMEPEARIRIDRIISLFGKPGACFDAYNAFVNACLIYGGYDEDSH